MKTLFLSVLFALSGCATQANESHSATKHDTTVTKPVSDDAPVETPNDSTTETASKNTSKTLRLTKSEVWKVINAHSGPIAACYEKQLSKNPELTGKLTFEWVVQIDGTAKDITETAANTLGDSEVSKCVANVIATIKFPQPQGGEVSIVFPWNFISISRTLIVCEAGEDLVLDGKSYEERVMIKTLGECTVTIRNSMFESSKVAVHVIGDAHVILENTTLVAPVAISAHSDSNVKVIGSTVNGAVELQGNAQLETTASTFSTEIVPEENAVVIDGGQNRFSRPK